MSWLRWELGRQGGGYDKFLLAVEASEVLFTHLMTKVSRGSVLMVSFGWLTKDRHG